MFLLGLMTLFDTKLMLPLPHFTMPTKTNVASTYLLGLFSGITSSCCAPVLFAAITLSSLSPTILTSLVVSFVYVLGIVFPLFFLSLFYEKMSNKYLYNMKNKFEKPLKLVAALTFMLSSVIIAYMALTGKIQMDANTEYGKFLRNFIFDLSGKLQNPILDILFLIVIFLLLKIMLKEAQSEGKKN